METFPLKVRQHLVEGDLVGSAYTDQSDDKGKVEEEDTKFTKSLPLNKENESTFLAAIL